MAYKTHFRAGSGDAALARSQFLAFYFHGMPVGNVFFVSSVNGNDTTGSGYSPEDALASIKQAITLCTADNGDYIIVLPNHSETMTTTGTITQSVSGVTILGLGVGRQRGTINYSTSTNASFDITGARTVVDNLTFVGTGIASLTAMVNVKAADVTIRNCEFECANATNAATDVIVTTTAANRMWVFNNDFHGVTSLTKHCVLINGGTDIEIASNNFQGAFHTSEGIVRVVTTATVNLVIDSNTMQNQTASNTKAIVDAITASTGQVRFNTMQILSGTAPITGATFSWVGNNYYSQTIATAGTLI